jgi:hypothetical protein
LGTADPLAGGEGCDLALVQAAGGFVIDVLDAGGGHFEASAAQQTGAALIVAVKPFAIDDERDALLDGERLDSRIALLLLDGGDHAVELEGFEGLDRWIGQHGFSASVIDQW